ncbi:lytic transglycosylase domain-containing protein [Pseudooceanicola marinus]|uniref:lytic transglycosylase domain-containing protein n=1 Tax=Pseudooceanicola marinus TaxID=396013 RepID=UPI001C9745A3|nr:lytic transglycosylase domain-containing protein [Pseudooceanicola marinus]MBY5973474.1 lytic transglycosylase domain-containing protein [Ferrimonas balearica]MCA1336281.1 lytic transglycosylase domain-containing protein [Pseudooceanicola marinus]
MRPLTTLTLVFACLLPLAACSTPDPEQPSMAFRDTAPLYPNETPELRGLIEQYAAEYEVPVTLVQRVVIRESTHRPGARNGPYYGLMQILPATARSMGFAGQPRDLLDAETNLKYAVKYLRGAWLLSDGDEATAVKWYARGYYFEAKRQDMLVETGLRSE